MQGSIVTAQSGAVCVIYFKNVPMCISLVLMWEQHVVMQLAPYHGASPCTVIITNPRHFFIDLGAKTSKCNSLFGPTSFFHSCFEREQAQNSQNSRQELQICSLSTKNRSCGRTNTGLIQKCPRVNRVWRDAGFDTHLSYKDTLNQALQCRAHTHAEI